MTPEERAYISNIYLSYTQLGAAAWQRGRVAPLPPQNAVTGRLYRGLNALRLMMNDESLRDPRFCTKDEAKEAGWGVEKEAKSVGSVWERQANGEGKMVSAFHVSSFVGVPRYEHLMPAWNAERIGDELVAKIGVKVVVEPGSLIFYDIGNDTLTLPEKPGPEGLRGYYSKMFHELLHATGHPSREGRNFGGSFASQEYALEEFRAQMATVLMASRLGLPFYAAEHNKLYSRAWFDLQRQDPELVFSVSKEAELLARRFLDFGREIVAERTQEQGQSQEVASFKFPDPAELQQRHPNRIYLFAKGKEYDVARSLGGTFYDAKAGLLYLPADADKSRFERWLTPPATLSQSDVIRRFRDACADHGLILDADPVMDGEWHKGLKVSTTRNKSKRAGAYVLNPNGTGQISNRDTGTSITWRVDGLMADDPQAREMMARARENAEAARREEVQRIERKEKQLAARWEKLPVLTEHAYLDRKQVPSFGLRKWGNDAVVPMMDADGVVHNLQTIPPETGGQKHFQKNARTGGMFFVLGELKPASTVLFAEGYATAATLHVATGLPVIVCFSAGNLEAVTKALESRLQGKDKIFCCDDDRVTAERAAAVLNGAARDKYGYPEISAEAIHVQHLIGGGMMELEGSDFILTVTPTTEKAHFGQLRLNLEIWRAGTETEPGVRIHQVTVKNSGMESGLAVAQTFGGEAIAPKFRFTNAADIALRDRELNDFNDLQVSEGLQRVQHQLANVVDLAKGREDAERYAVAHQYELIKGMPGGVDGQCFTGVAIGHVGSHMIQDVGGGRAAAHAHARLDDIPAVGEKAKIQYKDGRGALVPPRTKEIGRGSI